MMNIGLVTTRAPTSIPSTRTGRPQPRRRCRTPPGSTSRRSRRTRARGRRRCHRRRSCRADRHARAVRGHRYRVPGLVARSLAVDVGPHLGPRPAALGVHAHVAGVLPLPSFPISADRHARAVRGHRYRSRMVPAASPSMSEPTWVHVPPLSAYTRTWPAACRPSLRSADRHARAVRGHRYRPGRSRSLAVDVGPTWVHVPPLSAYTRTWPAKCRCRRSNSADRHARAVRGHRYRDPELSPQPRRRCLHPPGSTGRTGRV